MRRGIAFAAAAAVPLVLALHGGGYDIVIRQELGVVVWAAIALGFATGVFPRGRPTPLAWIVLGSWAALALLTALALAWTESDEHTFSELARTLQYMGLVALAFSALNMYTWRGAAAGLVTVALLVPLLSVIARLAPSLIADDTTTLFNIDRLSYPFGYWNAVGAWGAMAIAMGLAWSAHARSMAVRSLALAAVPVAALSVYLSYSRAGAIAVVIAGIATLILGRNRWTTAVHTLAAALGSAAVILVARDYAEIARATGDEGAGPVVGMLIVAAAICSAAVFATGFAGLDRRRLSRETNRIWTPVAIVLLVVVGGLAGHSQISEGWRQFRDDRTVAVGSDPASRLTSAGGSRYRVWQTAIDAFEAEPAKGIGPGSFEFSWSRAGKDPEFVRDTHNLYLEQLAELGVPGLVAILMVVGSLLACALAARRQILSRRGGASARLGGAAAVTAAFVVFLFSAGVDWMWELPAVGALAFGAAAAVGAAAFPRWGDAAMKPWPRAAIVVVAIVAAAIQVPGLVSVERLRASNAKLAAGDDVRALELANESVQAEPWAASPYAQRALVEQHQGRLDAARADLGRAIDREPTNWRHPLLLARVEAQAGDRDAVLKELAQVRKLAPMSVFLLPGVPGRGQIDAVLSRG